MKLKLLAAGICAAGLAAATLPGQTGSSQLQHVSVVVNIEVPVRVLKKNAFVDGLGLQDFEIFENGVRQPLEAVYLIRNKQVQRQERAAGAAPLQLRSARNYVLYLDLKEYIPRIGNALDYFFTDVLDPEDSLFVVTPAKTYRFKPEALSLMPGLRIAAQLKEKLRADILLGNSQYRRMMRDFYRLEAEPYPGDLIEVKERLLFDMAMQIRDLREITEGTVMGFADTLKSLDGEKHVFLIYQRDVLPEHDFSAEQQMDLFKPVGFDVDKIKRYYADAAITIHCLYITKLPEFSVNHNRWRSARLQDLSADVYASFKEMAAATGGLTESTTNPNFALRQAAEASGNYYLLYYRPLQYRADGGFQTIEVKVKGEGLRVFHRMGYIAD